MNLFIFTDGGARGNPGPAAVGIIIKDSGGKVIHKFGKRIGETTNNVAEYTAVIEALRWLTANNYQSAVNDYQFFLDSNLVVNQLDGLFRIKNADLRNLLMKVRELESSLGGNISYHQIPREKNFLADREVNNSLDKAI